MKKLTILGSGCARCQQLTEATRAAAEACGIAYEIEKVTDLLEFANYGVMITPALVIDGELKVSGKVPTLAELQTLMGMETS
ncbi:small redox-active disulfide protein 2 [Haloferula luteola]|uniref:Small redox-active disulfide protein 2 n=1 Tax=Haloferula luteola TaxID=595692 RepID=A0A840VA66_9BACT|nr:thioredoxin family protein [Haloferula luteola]MBB5352454.1 small redox-active disulfide protein 2 [Haloferula luteola]